MNKPKKVVVIGSGLSAFGAISALQDRDIKITVVDVGDLLPTEVAQRVEEYKSKSRIDRTQYFVDSFLRKPSSKNLHDKIPKKNLFGSHFFYKDEMINSEQSIPLSEAFGGYSVAWGAATLMSREEDLQNFPIDYGQILTAARAMAKRLPIPNFEDSLTPYFPNLNEKTGEQPLKLSPSQALLKEKLSGLISNSKDNLCLVGQARVATFSAGVNSCVYCGMCSSGCSYNSIFSTNQEILELHKQGKLDYLPNRRVIKLVEEENLVKIIFINLENNSKEEIEADYVFVAAGAVNSTKIAIETLGLKNEKIVMIKTGGFLRVYFSPKKIGFDWPQQNTQANIFMEVNNPKVSDYWIHNQISTPNESVINALGYLDKGFLAQFSRPLMKWFMSHLVFVMTNLHSGNGPYYELLSSGISHNVKFSGKLVNSSNTRRHERVIDRFMNWKLLRIGFLPIPFTKKGVKDGLGYHIGGSLPMGGVGKLATDSLGRLKGSSLVYFVDTSILPSIPATTIGFLTTANAFRIASAALIQD